MTFRVGDRVRYVGNAGKRYKLLRSNGTVISIGKRIRVKWSDQTETNNVEHALEKLEP